MAKWLNKYFSLGNNKTKSPPQPPRPDYYKDKKNGSTANHLPFSFQNSLNEESDLIREYRAQKERDFEDPYNNGPGSSLRKLRAMCQEYYYQNGEEDKRDKDRSKSTVGSPGTGSPYFQRSKSERRAGPNTPEIKFISPTHHRLIKIESSSTDNKSNVSNSPSTNNKQLNKSEESHAKQEKVPVADDYSDPFDAKSDLKNKTGKGENNGYMEPYEAQKLMAEIQRQENQKLQQKNIQLYDTPYEPEGSGVDSDSESIVNQRLRESRLPQDDDRPADEYDQPWEWNKVTIPALAAQLSDNEKRTSPSPSRDRRRQLRPPGGSFKPVKHGSPEFCGILGERVDPTIPLQKQIWYHGAINRTDSENLLRLCKECSYLVRNSQTSKHDYSLSLKSSQGFMHMKLTRTKEKYILGQNSPPFDSVPEVIHYYTTRKLPIKGAEHLSLLYPVAVRTL
ncbi:SH2 domain-containing adapter protein B isoform X2 [Protopterus annectens]|uniref:SH2 domain-containing adapter protein B isoform X2 n=1 Tax=Protopterus annectens TaxID=7888 RepID=UPI001CFB9A86|nr:SH2 domain-containing adapter protein B isoform X2 [Protopterus annectens]